jgi:hypothetical protein
MRSAGSTTTASCWPLAALAGWRACCTHARSGGGWSSSSPRLVLERLPRLLGLPLLSAHLVPLGPPLARLARIFFALVARSAPRARGAEGIKDGRFTPWWLVGLGRRGWLVRVWGSVHLLRKIHLNVF